MPFPRCNLFGSIEYNNSHPNAFTGRDKFNQIRGSRYDFDFPFLNGVSLNQKNTQNCLNL